MVRTCRRFATLQYVSDHSSHIMLEDGPEGLELRRPEDRPGQGVRAGFEGLSTRGHPFSKLLRGCDGPVIDATAGLGGDTGVLAALGWHVLAIEREPNLFKLLEQAHQRIQEPDLQDRITLLEGDAIECLPSLPEAFRSPAAIILDPMYPPRRKSSALPSKGMQALRLLHGETVQSTPEVLLLAAFAASPGRVVLKRPPEAPSLTARPPTFSVGSKLVRWDAWELG
jgi:16S rRNA (guanine1516-N2)-methyltransferase